MTTVESNLETKLTQLEINVKKTNVVIESQNSEAIERHLQTLKAISDTVNHLRLEVEATKIEWKVDIAPITKFTYLRELVTPQVIRTIEALPFTAEGYNRVKTILKERFGKDSEIIKGYTKEILELPTLTGTNPKAISDFSEKLTYCVQALQTLNKLEQANGATLMTLDKLPGIRGDLV